jgi:hypothetical protein
VTLWFLLIIAKLYALKFHIFFGDSPGGCKHSKIELDVTAFVMTEGLLLSG